MVMRALIATMLTLSCGTACGQFRCTFTSVPDSAEVRVNGTTRCHTPCRVKYSWRQARDGRLLFEVTAPGYTTWSDTLWKKPSVLNEAKEVNLIRQLPRFDVRGTTAIVAFDRLLADFTDGTEVGSYTNEEGRVEALKWDGYTKLGEHDFETGFYEVLHHAGFATPLHERSEPLSGSGKEWPTPPRFLVGVRLLKYNVALKHKEGEDFGAGPVKGRVRMQLEWQVMDKSSGSIALRDTTEGFVRIRQGAGRIVSGNLMAFESALIAFLDSGGLVDLVKQAPYTSAAATPQVRVTDSLITIARPELPPFDNLSEMIKQADRSCVTVITDGGHGRGVIINSEGYVLSAHHVIEGVNRIEVQFSDGLRQAAHVVREDKVSDLVLLDIDGSGFKPLAIGVSAGSRMGDEVITIGTPADLELGQSVARGILSGKRKFEEQIYLQTDMAVSPGNSGGPLLNARGEIIGIIQRNVVAEGVEGIGFAIPIDRAMEVLRLRTGQ